MYCKTFIFQLVQKCEFETSALTTSISLAMHSSCINKQKYISLLHINLSVFAYPFHLISTCYVVVLDELDLY